MIERKRAEWRAELERALGRVDDIIDHPDIWEEEVGRLAQLARHLGGHGCPGCGGVGRRDYADTSTWRGGIGGQAFSDGVCDMCWGTGRRDVVGADLRRLPWSDR